MVILHGPRPLNPHHLFSRTVVVSLNRVNRFLLIEIPGTQSCTYLVILGFICKYVIVDDKKSIASVKLKQKQINIQSRKLES